MNSTRTYLLLTLFLVGIGLIIASQYVESGPIQNPDGIDLEEDPLAATGDPDILPTPTPQPATVQEGEEQNRQAICDANMGPVVTGLVLDDQGAPVAGARVEALEFPPLQTQGNQNQLADFMQGYSEVIKQRAGRGEIDLQSITVATLKKFATVSIPAKGSEFATLTEKDGSFALGPIPWASGWIRAGKGTMVTPAWIQVPPAKDLTLIIQPGGALKVRVRGPADKPLCACPVRILNQNDLAQMNGGNFGANRMVSYCEGLTDAKGEAHFFGLSTKGTFLALALPPGRQAVAAPSTSVGAGEIKTITIHTRPGANLLVTVNDPEGTPLAGVKINCLPLDISLEAHGMLPLTNILTDKSGQAKFTNLPLGSCLVQGLCAMWEPVDKKIKLSPDKTNTVNLVLAPGITMHGRVVDEEGAPVADALVAMATIGEAMGFDITSFVPPLLLLDPLSSTRTAGDGSFTLGGLPARKITLLSWAPGYAIYRKNGIWSRAGKTLTITLNATGGLAGQILDSAGKPVTAFSLSLYQDGFMGMKKLACSKKFTTTDGKFRMLAIEPGGYSLRVDALDRKEFGLAAKEIPNLEVDRGEVYPFPRPIILEFGAQVIGRVKDQKGKPVTGARVTLTNTGNSQMFNIPGFSVPKPEATSIADGLFKITNVPAGEWRISANADENGQITRKEPLITRSGEALKDVILELAPPCTLEGLVYNDQGSLSKGTMLILQRIEAGAFLQLYTRTDDQGHFKKTGLGPGRWQVIRMSSGVFGNALSMQKDMRKSGTFDLGSLINGMQMVVAKLAPGEHRRITLGNPAGSGGSITGFVRQGSSPCKRAMIIAIKSGKKSERPALAITDNQGEFTFDNLLPGKYTVVLQSSLIGIGGDSVKRVVQVQPGEEARIEVEFGSGVIKGKLRSSGKTSSLANRFLVLKDLKGRHHGVVITDASGKFLVKGVSHGNYILEVAAKPEFGPKQLAGRSRPLVLVRGGAEIQVEIPVQPAASLRGSVVGKQVANSMINVYTGNWPKPTRVRTDANGLFTMHGVIPGKARIEAQNGKFTGSLELNLVPGQNNALIIHLELAEK